MIAKYIGKYFCVDTTITPVQIWAYVPVEGFTRKSTRRGTVYYEKYVDISEIDKIFDVGFSVCWDGEWCGVFYSAEKNLLSVGTNNRDFAVAHDMEEFERGTFGCAVSASKFNEYRMYTQDFGAKEKTYTMVSYQEFKALWKQMIAELIPPRG